MSHDRLSLLLDTTIFRCPRAARIDSSLAEPRSPQRVHFKVTATCHILTLQRVPQGKIRLSCEGLRSSEILFCTSPTSSSILHPQFNVIKGRLQIPHLLRCKCTVDAM